MERMWCTFVWNCPSKDLILSDTSTCSHPYLKLLGKYYFEKLKSNSWNCNIILIWFYQNCNTFLHDSIKTATHSYVTLSKLQPILIYLYQTPILCSRGMCPCNRTDRGAQRSNTFCCLCSSCPYNGPHYRGSWSMTRGAPLSLPLWGHVPLEQTLHLSKLQHILIWLY